MRSVVELTARALCALLLLAATVWCGYLSAHKLLPRATPSARWAGAVIAAIWWLQVSFRLLASVHAFALLPAVAGWAIAAGAATMTVDRGAVWAQLRAEVAAAAHTLGDPALRTARPFLLLGGVMIGARVLRGLVAPPLAYDSLLYHLYKPAQWVVTGRLWREAGPDWWSFLNAYPIGAEILLGWTLLPLRGDGAVALCGLLIGLACVLAVFATARALGCTRTLAMLAAGASALVPATVSYLTAGYSDTTLLLGFVMSALFLQRASHAGERGDAILAAAALGVTAAVKHSGLPMLAAGSALLAIVVIRRSHRPLAHRMATLALCFGVAGMAALPDYLWLLGNHGSPLYPLLGSNPLLAALFSGEILPAGLRSFNPWAFGVEVWLGPRGLGLIAPATVALGLWGAARVLARTPTSVTASFLLMSAWMPAVVLFSPSHQGLRGFWIYSISRFFTPFLIAMILTTAAAGGRLATAVLTTSLAAGAIYAWPRGWGVVDLWGVAALLMLLGAGAAAVLLARLIGRRLRRPVAATALGAVLALAMVPYWDDLRAGLRYRVYAAAAAGTVYDVHPSRLPYWPLWQAVDDGTPHVVAAVAGWNGIGHNWTRYPLLGTRLQNQVLYLPPTADGRIVDYRDPRLAGAASYQHWLQRLRAAGVDRVVNLGAAPPEAGWMIAHPELFEPLAETHDRTGQVYRLRRPSP